MAKKKKSLNELWVKTILDELHSPEYEREFRFHPKRKWRMDFAWAQLQVFLEVEGAGHNFYHNFHRDMEKYNTAAFMGWRLLRISSKMINDKGGAGLYFMRDFVALLNALEKQAVER